MYYRIKIAHTHNDDSQESLTQWASEDQFILSAFPDYNFAVVLEYLNDNEQLSSNAKFLWGSDALNKRNCRNCVTINQKYSISTPNADKTNVLGSLEVKVPIMSVSESLGFDFSHSTENIAFSLNYQGDERFRVNLTSGENSQEVEVMSPTRWGNFNLKGEIKKVDTMHYVMEGKLSFANSPEFQMTAIVEVASQSKRKLLSVMVDGDRGNLLNLKTDTKMTKTGFETENLLVTHNFPDFILNLSHNNKKSKPDFNTDFHFELDPFKLVLNVDGSLSKKTIKTDVIFNTKSGEKDQTLKVNLDYVDQPASREAMRYSGTLEAALDIQGVSVKSLLLSGGFHRTVSGKNVIEGELVSDEKTLAGLLVSASLNPLFDLSVNFKQKLNLPFESVNLNLVVDQRNKNGKLDFSMDDNKMLELTTEVDSNSVSITSFQKFSSIVPRDIEAKIQYTDKLLVEGTVDNQSIIFTGQVFGRNRVLLTLNHKVSILSSYSVPRSIKFDANYGMRSDRKSGFWSTLTLDESDSTLEAMYIVESSGGKHVVEVDLNPSGNLLMAYLVPFNARFVLNVLEDDSINFTDEYKLNNEIRASHVFTYQDGGLTFTGKQTLFEEIFPRIPTNINLKISWKSAYEIVFGLVYQGAESNVSAKLDYDSLLKMMAHCSMEINLPFLSGIYEAGFLIKQDKFNADVDFDDKKGSLSLTWDFDEGEYEMTMTQDFYTLVVLINLKLILF